MTHTNSPTNEEELRYKITMAVYPSCRIIETTGGSMGSSLFTVDENEVNTLADAVMQLLHQYVNTRELEGSDLKYILQKLPKRREGRELTLNYDRDDNHWYVGYPNESWDFSIDLHANDKDPEGACLNLLSQFDELTKAKGEE